jgi:Putative DNA-binding domain
MMDNLMATLLGRSEAKDLDFKGPMGWDPKGDQAGCCGLVKDIIAMANTMGGHLVIGVQEVATGLDPVGLLSAELANWDTTKLNQFVNRYADPPINATLLKREHLGNAFVVIEVPAFPDMPHVCSIDFPGVLRAATIYVRTDNNESAAVGSARDLNAILDRGVRNRSDRMLEAMRTILVGATSSPPPTDRERFDAQRAEAAARFGELYPFGDRPYSGFLRTASWPARFEEDRFPVEHLRKAIEAATVAYRDWPFLYTQWGQYTYRIPDGIETSVALTDPETYRFWQLRTSGLLFQQILMWEDPAYVDRLPRTMATIESIVGYVAEAIDSIARLYPGLDVESEQVTVRFELLGTEGRQLVSGRGRRLRGPYVARYPSFVSERVMPIEEWVAGRVDHAMEVARTWLTNFNWEQPSIPRADVEELLSGRR